MAKIVRISENGIMRQITSDEYLQQHSGHRMKLRCAGVVNGKQCEAEMVACMQNNGEDVYFRQKKGGNGHIAGCPYDERIDIRRISKRNLERISLEDFLRKKTATRILKTVDHEQNTADATDRAESFEKKYSGYEVIAKAPANAAQIFNALQDCDPDDIVTRDKLRVRDVIVNEETIQKCRSNGMEGIRVVLATTCDYSRFGKMENTIVLKENYLSGVRMECIYFLVRIPNKLLRFEKMKMFHATAPGAEAPKFAICGDWKRVNGYRWPNVYECVLTNGNAMTVYTVD